MSDGQFWISVLAAGLLVAWAVCEAWEARCRWREGRQRRTLIERGRRLASERDELIAQGVDPAELVVPIHPEDAA